MCWGVEGSKKRCGERCGRVYGVSGEVLRGGEGRCEKKCGEVCWGVGSQHKHFLPHSSHLSPFPRHPNTLPYTLSPHLPGSPSLTLQYTFPHLPPHFPTPFPASPLTPPTLPYTYFHIFSHLSKVWQSYHATKSL